MWTPRALSEERERQVYWWGVARPPAPPQSPPTAMKGPRGLSPQPALLPPQGLEEQGPRERMRGQSRGALCPQWGTVPLEICGRP